MVELAEGKLAALAPGEEPRKRVYFRQFRTEAIEATLKMSRYPPATTSTSPLSAFMAEPWALNINRRRG